MQIKVILPAVRTYEPSYQTSNTSIDVILGFMTNHVNVENPEFPVNVYLKDTSNDEIILNDNITVLLNAFITTYRIDNLQPDKIYAFIIESGFQQYTTTIITTISDTSVIRVVGREHVFSQNAIYYGDSIEPLDDGTIDFKKGLDLKNNTTGNGLVVDQNITYAFCPTHVITTRQDYPNIIVYRPLIGLGMQSIIVNKIPLIIKRSNTLFEVVPSTVMRIINLDANVDITTTTPVTLIDLTAYGITSWKTIIRPVWESIPK